MLITERRRPPSRGGNRLHATRRGNRETSARSAAGDDRSTTDVPPDGSTRRDIEIHATPSRLEPPAGRNRERADGRTDLLLMLLLHRRAG